MRLAKKLPLQLKNVLGRPKDVVKRDGIVRAAATLFFKDGYVLTSMEAIAKKADVSKLTIYSHFANKDELFKEVVLQRCDKGAMPDSFISQSTQDVEHALTGIGTNLANLLFSPESLRMYRIMQAEAAHHPKVVQIYYDAGPKRVRAAFAGLLREWVRRGELSIPDVSRATEQFFSLLKGELMMKISMLQAPPPSKLEVKKHVRATVAFFLAAYRTKNIKGQS